MFATSLPEIAVLYALNVAREGQPSYMLHCGTVRAQRPYNAILLRDPDGYRAALAEKHPTIYEVPKYAFRMVKDETTGYEREFVATRPLRGRPVATIRDLETVMALGVQVFFVQPGYEKQVAEEFQTFATTFRHEEASLRYAAYHVLLNSWDEANVLVHENDRLHLGSVDIMSGEYQENCEHFLRPGLEGRGGAIWLHALTKEPPSNARSFAEKHAHRQAGRGRGTDYHPY